MTGQIPFGARHVALALVFILTSAMPASGQPNPWRPDRPSFEPVTRGPLTLEANAGLGDSDPGLTSGGLAHRIPFGGNPTSGRFEIAGMAGRSPEGGGKYGRLDGRALFDIKSGGLWLGAAAHYDDHQPGQLSSLLGMGGWLRHRDWTSSLGLEQTSDVATHTEYFYSVADTGFVALDHQQPIRRASLHAGIGWARGRVALESMAGVSVSPTTGPRRWLRGSAAVALIHGLTLVATGGSKAPDLFGYPEQHQGQATLGFRVTPSWGGRHDTGHSMASPAWSVRREGDGWYTIEVYASDARTVEITSDATSWEARSLSRASNDRWRLRLHLDDGIYHINLRIDGGPWTVPPGVPTATDEFIGDTGLLVIGP